MRGFRYKHGDRPLEGYTIQRAAGRGGFGEVYYAISDSGREVALKMVNGYEQIELRGVGQCMNLKSPHLVTIFDVKHNDEGVPFVIMEFVSGPSMRQLLDESPSGLGTQKTAFFLREIGKGLSYLHECGIVHRDLKPGNIFYENGYVKIGDYGLSKAMAASQHSGQTITVGTVHYMAPEISMGKYDRSIDIYAMGAMLFEMLTGTPPYLGASPGEILMKHMSAEPNVAGIEEPFATVIRKAMARDPKDRYQSVQEMIEAVFGAEHVRESVSCFSPDSLSMVAERVAQRVAVGGGSATPPPLPPRGGAGDAGVGIGAWGDRFGQKMEQIGDRMEQWGERFGQRMERFGQRMAGQQVQDVPQPAAAPVQADARRDPVTLGVRMMVAAGLLAVLGIAAGWLGTPSRYGNLTVPIAILGFLGAAGGTWGLRLAHRRILPQLVHDSSGIQKLAVGGVATIGMVGASLPICLAGSLWHIAGQSLLAVMFPLFLMNWQRVMTPERAHRVEFGHAFWAGVLGMIAAFIFRAMPELAVAMLAGISLAVQVTSPWDPVAARSRRYRPVMGVVPPVPASDAPTMMAAGGAGEAAVAMPPAVPLAAARMPRVVPPAGSAVPAAVHVLWLIGAALVFSLGLIFLIYSGVSHVSDDELALFVAFGVGFLLLSILGLRKALQTTFGGWWRYLWRPLAAWACMQTILLSAISLGNMRLDDEEQAVAIFFIILPGLLLLILAFVRLRDTGRPASVALRAIAAVPPVPQAVELGVDAVVPPPLPCETPAAAMPVSAASMPTLTVGDVLAHSRNIFLSLVGHLLMGFGVLAALSLAADIPQMLGAGLPEPKLAEDLKRDLGPNAFRLIETTLFIAASVAMFLATAFLMLARRWQGLAPMLRALAGVCVIAMGLWSLDYALGGTWQIVFDSAGRVSMPDAVDAYMQGVAARPAVFAGLFMLVGLALLIWPASRRQPDVGAA